MGETVESTGDRKKATSNVCLSTSVDGSSDILKMSLSTKEHNLHITIQWKIHAKIVLWLFTINIVYHRETINLVWKIEILQISKSRVIPNCRIDVWEWHHPPSQILKWINKQSLCESLEKNAMIIG